MNSFVSLAEQGFYDDTPCPRIGDQEGFGILQCGDPTGTGAGGAGYSFADELSGDETYPAGTLAMANAGPDTNGSQFFLVFRDSQFPPSYTVFGTIDEAGLRHRRDRGRGQRRRQPRRRRRAQQGGHHREGHGRLTWSS